MAKVKILEVKNDKTIIVNSYEETVSVKIQNLNLSILMMFFNHLLLLALFLSKNWPIMSRNGSNQ